MEKLTKIKWTLLVSLLILVFLLSMVTGRYLISPIKIISILYNSISNGYVEKSLESSIIFNIRLPRTLMTMLVGASLSAAGATYQGIFRNQLVSPDVLGVSSGAAFGAAFAILVIGTPSWISILSFIFGIFSILLTYFFAKSRGEISMMSLVLSGIIVSAIFSALVSLIKYVADPYEKLPTIIYWLMGSFSKITYGDLKIIILPISIGLLFINLLRWRINILSLGDEEAKTLGVNPRRMRFILIVLATIITAISTSVVGIVGWVGLVVPHMARILYGSDHKNLIPASCIIGAIFLTIVDMVARSAISAEIPISIITSLLGAPFFGFLMKKIRRARGDY